MTYRFHVLGVPHTASSKFYSQCAFTQKTVNICKMLKMHGHTVYHYGNELSQIECDEHISVTALNDINPPHLSGVFDQNSPTYAKFNAGCIDHLGRRKRPGDFLISFWPTHHIIAEAHPEMIVVEAGIGYPSGHWAKYQVFESYAMLHAYLGLNAVGWANGADWWHKVVIPNSYDPADFSFSPARGQYLLFMGLRANGGAGKGDYLAVEIARRSGMLLKMAGSGFYHGKGVQCVGFVSGKQRAELYANAYAVLCPSMFVEPFCGAHVEAMMSGVPVITTDWGAFAEYNVEGMTGYRCRSMGEFVDAVKKVKMLSRRRIRNHALETFSIEVVSEQYENYWRQVKNESLVSHRASAA